MDETIRKIIYNNCGIQDGATLVGYIEDILDRNDRAIEYIKAVGVIPKNIDIFVLLDILKGSDKE